ncbi:MAG: DUF2721 domain-containing protein [Bacteroidota bacterium]
MTIVDLIQAMLAPGIMISACGLLLLGMNNKYSLVVNRIRLLDDEKRKLKGTYTKSIVEENRFNSIQLQLIKFGYRIKMVRNAVISYSLAVGFFIMTCLAIGLRFSLEDKGGAAFALILFLAGMISVFFGVLFAVIEVIKGYEIVQIEIKQDNQE